VVSTSCLPSHAWRVLGGAAVLPVHCPHFACQHPQPLLPNPPTTHPARTSKDGTRPSASRGLSAFRAVCMPWVTASPPPCLAAWSRGRCANGAAMAGLPLLMNSASAWLLSGISRPKTYLEANTSIQTVSHSGGQATSRVLSMCIPLNPTTTRIQCQGGIKVVCRQKQVASIRRQARAAVHCRSPWCRVGSTWAAEGCRGSKRAAGRGRWAADGRPPEGC
jgi:hypothetical protein